MPFGVPPPDVLLTWPAPNFVNPERRGAENYVVGSILLGLSTIVLAIRLYARIFIRKWLGLDDLFIVIAWLGTIGVTTCVFLGVADYGWDRHLWDIHPAWFQGSAKMFQLSSIFWAISSSFVRLSLLCFFYRLAAHLQFRRYIMVLHVFTFISVAFLISYMISLICLCVPAENFYKYPLSWKQMKCLNIPNMIFTFTIINTILEFAISLLPIPAILSLDMTRRERLSVMGVMCLGVFVFLIGCIRCWWVWKSLLDSYDTSWWGGPQWVVSEFENNIALICSCTPALRPILGRIITERKLHPSIPSEDDLVLPHHPSFGPREFVRTPQGDEPACIDLEGIAPDGRGYTLRVKNIRHHPALSTGRRTPSDSGDDSEKGNSGWRRSKALSRRVLKEMVVLSEKSIMSSGRTKDTVLDRVDEADDEADSTMSDDDDRSFGNVEIVPAAGTSASSSMLGFDPAMAASTTRNSRIDLAPLRMPHMNRSKVERLREPSKLRSEIFPTRETRRSTAANDHLSWASIFDKPGHVSPERRWSPSPTNLVNTSHSSMWAGRTSPDHRQDQGRFDRS